MSLSVKLHRTVGVRVGSGSGVQVGGGADRRAVDDDDRHGGCARDGPAASTSRAGSEMVRVTVNVPRPWPCSRSDSACSMLDTAPLDRRLPLQRPPPAHEYILSARGRSTSTASTWHRQPMLPRMSSSRRFARWRRSREAGTHRRQRRSLNQELAVAKMQRTPIATSASRRRTSSTSAWSSATESTALAIESGLRGKTRSSSLQDRRGWRDLIAVSRAGWWTDQPLHLG